MFEVREGKASKGDCEQKRMDVSGWKKSFQIVSSKGKVCTQVCSSHSKASVAGDWLGGQREGRSRRTLLAIM